MPKPYLLGVDAGTSLVKAVVFDHGGNEVGLSRMRVPVVTSRQDWAEQDMEHVWQAVKGTIGKCLQTNNISASDIAGIGVCGQGDGCRLLDRQFRPLRNSILWTDGRAGDIITAWEESGLSLEGFKINGSAIFAGAPAAIIEWLSRNEPDTLDQASYFLFAKDWIKFKLTGKIVTDPSDASRAPFDIRQGKYSSEVLKMVGLEAFLYLFPEIRPSADIIGEVTKTAAEETGLQIGTPVINGMIDVVACGLGVGAVSHGQAYSIVGTTCFNGVIMDAIDLEPMGIGMTLAYAFDQQVLRAMPSLAGTPNVDWFVDQFCQSEKKDAKESNTELFYSLEKQISKMPVGCDGLVYHPYINPGGERAPFVKTSAAAQFFGLSSNHTRWHLLRAVYEGVALSLLDCFEKFPVSISQLMLCGGGAQSALWCQIISDATGKPVHVPGGCELGALGTAVMTALATGVYPNVETAVEQAVDLAAGYEPNLENHEIYRELYGLYKNLYQHVWDDWDLRAAILKRLEKQ